jgi:hypothetical protein
MALKPTPNLDDFVSAAGAAVGEAHSAGRVTSAIAPRPATEADLETLIGAAGGVSQNKATKAPAPKVGASKTAAQADFRDGLHLDGLVHKAAHSLNGGRFAATNAGTSVSTGRATHDAATDISQLIANVAGHPSTTAPPVVANGPTPAARVEPEAFVARPAGEDRAVSPAKRTASRNVGPWVTAVVIAALVGGAVWFGYQHRETKALPTIAGGPQFQLTAKQKELVEHLRAAHAEVERYRQANGRLPSRIEMKVRGVVFYIRPVKDSYMLMAVSEHQNLVLMGDGRWHKAR